MKKSTNYELNLVEGSDVVNPLVQEVPNWEKTDEVMFENACNSVSQATELLSGTVHALTRENPNSAMFRFVATSDFTAGDTFTVDGVQVTALLTTGVPLNTGSYVINSNVLCCLVGTNLTIFASSGGDITANDSEKLGGELPSHYASAEDVENALAVAQSANTISLSNKERLDATNLVRLTNDVITTGNKGVSINGYQYGNVVSIDIYIPAGIFEGGTSTNVCQLTRCKPLFIYGGIACNTGGVDSCNLSIDTDGVVWIIPHAKTSYYRLTATYLISDAQKVS